MKSTIRNGWLEIDKGTFWAHYRDGKETGLTIARIPPWPPEKPVNKKTIFHVRYYSSNQLNKGFDIGSRSTLSGAKHLAESKLKDLINVL